MEVTNRTLSNLLRGLVSKKLKKWYLKLPHVDFSYNQALTYATSHSPFEAYNGINPLTPIDLLPLTIEHRVRFEA